MKLESFDMANFIPLALQKNYEEIEKVISADDFDVNMKDSKGFTVFHVAAQLGDVKLIEMVLNQHPKADISSKTYNSMSTPLMIAAVNGKAEIIKILLEHGADTACQDAAGNTALMFATSGIKVECADLLLNSGKNCNILAQNLNGHSALMLALGSLELTEKLIGNSDITQVDCDGNSILHILIQTIDNSDVLKLVLDQQKILINARDSSGATPLLHAVWKKKLDYAYVLIEKGADLLAKDKIGADAFGLAVISDDTEEFIIKYENQLPEDKIEGLFIDLVKYNRLATIKRLISKVGEVCIGKSLVMASSKGHLECCKFLLEHLKDPVEDMLFTAVMEALRAKYFEIFRFVYEILLKAAKESETFLKTNKNLIISTACSSGCLEACKFLLDEGVDPNGFYPLTPLTIATEAGHLEIVELLIENGAEVNKVHEQFGSDLLVATINGHFDIVDLLIKKGASPLVSDSAGYTPLISAACRGYFEIFLRVFEVDKNVEQRTNDGITPLLGACNSGNRETVEFLLKNGADINDSDSYGYNCLHFAALENYDNPENLKNFDALLYLITFIQNYPGKLDFMLRSKSVKGRTPLDLIVSRKDKKLVHDLISNESVLTNYFLPIDTLSIE